MNAPFPYSHRHRYNSLTRAAADTLSRVAATMSKYLIRRIEENASIVVRARTEIIGLEGRGHLERVRWRDNRTGRTETSHVAHVFVMAGTVPNTGWLNGCVALDEKGFVKTGPDQSADD
jgi:thioredoxin reductase (NADPH)